MLKLDVALIRLKQPHPVTREHSKGEAYLRVREIDPNAFAMALPECQQAPFASIHRFCTPTRVTFVRIARVARDPALRVECPRIREEGLIGVDAQGTATHSRPWRKSVRDSLVWTARGRVGKSFSWRVPG